MAALLAGCAAPANIPPPPEPAVFLWRLDCGQFDIDNIEGRGRVLMPVSCYLIQHGRDLVLFDAGLDADLLGKTLRKNGQTVSLDTLLSRQLSDIGIDPSKIGMLVISHYHGDHHGQADLISNARLLMGVGDIEALRAEGEAGALKQWIFGNRPVDAIAADRDLFGDGTVRILSTPGHTPGHLSMMVTLKSGSYVLSGDLVHDHDQLAMLEPSANHVDKERGRVEIARVVKMAADAGATIIVGHDRDDLDKLPAFPAMAH